MPLTKYIIQLSRSKDEIPEYTMHVYAKSYEEAIEEAKTYVAKYGFWSYNSSVEERMRYINVSHVNTYNTAIKSVEVMSACALDILAGIVGIFGITVSISMTIREYIIHGISQALGLCFPMMLILLLSLLLVQGIGMYTNRKQFTIYFITPDNYADINYIKKKYMIIDVNEEFIAFTERENYNNWYSFKVSQDVKELYHTIIVEE